MYINKKRLICFVLLHSFYFLHNIWSLIFYLYLIYHCYCFITILPFELHEIKYLCSVVSQCTVWAHSKCSVSISWARNTSDGICLVSELSYMILAWGFSCNRSKMVTGLGLVQSLCCLYMWWLITRNLRMTELQERFSERTIFQVII